MKNGLVYAKVSTKEQAEKGLSIFAQLKVIRKYAVSYGFRILHETEASSLRSLYIATRNRNIYSQIFLAKRKCQSSHLV